MRIHVHDYSGHPFQVQLSRELARRGHSVVHQYSAEYVSGHGRLVHEDDDPTGFSVEAISAGVELRKYDIVARLRYESRYAQAWRRRLRSDPDVELVIVCNVPLFALARVRRYLRSRGLPWVLWHQDVYSSAVGDEIRRRLPAPVATPLSAAAVRLEKAQVRDATRVVAISESFLERYAAWGLDTNHAEVLQNWAPLDDIRPGPHINAWVERRELPSVALRLLYAGTLGRKHNPLLLLTLLDAVRAAGIDADLVVCSEGIGADDLAAATAQRPDVHLFGFQPADELSDVLASADAVVALLEPTAAAFSVPSKVLSYLAAGRPVVLLAPGANPASAEVLAAGGFVAEPTSAGARGAAAWLADAVLDPGRLDRLGHESRLLAEQRFGIGSIADRFEATITEATTAVATTTTTSH